LGKSRSHIANIIRLLQLPDEIINYLKNGILTPGHGVFLFVKKADKSGVRLT